MGVGRPWTGPAAPEERNQAARGFATLTADGRKLEPRTGFTMETTDARTTETADCALGEGTATLADHRRVSGADRLV